MKVMRVLGVIVLTFGGMLSGRAAYLHVKAELAVVLIRRAWEEEARTGRMVKPWGWADMHPVARLTIPRIGYDEYVLDNAAPRTLAFGPGVVANGTTPGDEGNLAIAGHRTSWFLPLKEVESGDQIELEWFDAKKKKLCKKEYVVKKIEVVEPTDVRLLKPTEEDALTLITCYPFGYGAWSPQRYVVRAQSVKGKTGSVNEL